MQLGVNFLEKKKHYTAEHLCIFQSVDKLWEEMVLMQNDCHKSRNSSHVSHHLATSDRERIRKLVFPLLNQNFLFVYWFNFNYQTGIRNEQYAVFRIKNNIENSQVLITEFFINLFVNLRVALQDR